jgi:hypothetical protein
VENACFGATAAAGENVRAKEKGIGKREVCERGNSVATTARNSMRDTALANSKWSARMCKGYSRPVSVDAALQEAESDAATCLSLVRPRAARAVAWAVERKATASVRQAAGLRGSEGAADEKQKRAERHKRLTGGRNRVTDLATRETPVFEVEAEWLHRSTYEPGTVVLLGSQSNLSQTCPLCPLRN